MGHVDERDPSAGLLSMLAAGRTQSEPEAEPKMLGKTQPSRSGGRREAVLARRIYAPIVRTAGLIVTNGPDVDARWGSE